MAKKQADEMSILGLTNSDMDKLQSEAGQLADMLQARDGFRWINRFRDQIQRIHTLTSKALSSRGARDLRLMEEGDQIDEEADPMPSAHEFIEEGE